MPEIVADGETGFLVPVDDVQALTERLLGDAELRRRMGAAGLRRTQELFTWPKVGARMVDSIGRALEPRS